MNVSDLIQRFSYLQFLKVSFLRKSLVNHVVSALSSLFMLLEDETSSAIFISALTLSE